MKIYIALTLLFLSSITRAQEITTGKASDTTAIKSYGPFSSFERKSTMITLSAGIADWNKENYKLPAGFINGTTSGFTPIYLKVEHGISSNVSIAVNIMHDAFYYNYAQTESGNGATFLRYQRDAVNDFSAGLAGYYHFNKLIKISNLDLFVGIGGTINHIKHSEYPQADSTASLIDHTVSPHLKVGGRYYINKYVSFYGDVGYDQISIASIGLSCRFY
jgi:hypothetical protein